MLSSWGHRSRALAVRRWRSEVLVDSGGLAIWPSCPTCRAAPCSACRPAPMSSASAMLSTLSWSPCRAGPRRRSGWWCGRGWCCWRLMTWRTARSRSGWASARTRPASGGDGTASRASRAGRRPATRTSPSRPGASLTSTSGNGKDSRPVRTSTSPGPTRNPASSPDARPPAPDLVRGLVALAKNWRQGDVDPDEQARRRA